MTRADPASTIGQFKGVRGGDGSPVAVDRLTGRGQTVVEAGSVDRLGDLSASDRQQGWCTDKAFGKPGRAGVSRGRGRRGSAGCAMGLRPGPLPIRPRSRLAGFLALRRRGHHGTQPVTEVPSASTGERPAVAVSAGLRRTHLDRRAPFLARMDWFTQATASPFGSASAALASPLLGGARYVLVAPIGWLLVGLALPVAVVGGREHIPNWQRPRH